MTGIDAKRPSRLTPTGTDEEVTGKFTTYNIDCPAGAAVPRFPNTLKLLKSGRETVAASTLPSTTGLEIIPLSVMELTTPDGATAVIVDSKNCRLEPAQDWLTDYN